MILTIDIGGTNIKYGLCDESGNIQHKGEYPTLDTADKIVQSICDLPFVIYHFFMMELRLVCLEY